MSKITENIRIVLIETSHPGNIGAAARAMKNMCLSSLHLVSPCVYPSAEATSRASGADDLLMQARVHTNLDQALEGCRLVIGTSARTRSLGWPLLSPRECASQLVLEADSGPVALVFGRERTGLSNEELERCHYLVHIPCNPDYSSLNIAAAVQVLSYEILMALSGGGDASDAGDEKEDVKMEPLDQPATADNMARFYQHLEQNLASIDFLDPENPKHLMRRLKRLYNRARPDNREMNILRGILTAVDKALKSKIQ